MPIAGQVAIVGSAATNFGVHHDRGYLDLLEEAGRGAIADAGLEPAAIEAAWLGTAHPELVALQGDSGTAVTQTLGLAPRPVTRVSAYCATGMEAVRGGAMAIAAGEYEVVLAVGAEKMRDVSPRGSLVARVANLTHPTLAKGRSGPGQFALLANRYLTEFDRTRTDLAAVAVKNHEHATRNPIAQYSDPITIEQVLAAPFVAEPLGVLDSTPTTDGAAAVILTTVERARAWGKPFAVLDGVGFAVVDGYYSGLYAEDNDFLGFRSTREAAKVAYAQAGIDDPRTQLDLIECHDCFTITEIVNYEDLGIAARGSGWKLLEEGATSVGGDIPVNLSGGLQSCGHPIGATGVRVVKEVADQVTGRAGQRQVQGARRGLAHTLGGPGVLSSVMIISSGNESEE
jgi:acetyl-CoA C-acetyltransferase